MEIDIERLALLARIKLADKEKEKFKQEFEAILSYISQLEEVDTSGLEGPSAGRMTTEENITRQDDPDDFNVTGDLSEILLKEAPLTHKGFVKVKNVFAK